MPDAEILARAAQNLRAARMVVAPSAVAVARALGLTNGNQWTRYETGERKPSLAVLVQFCDAYGVSLDFILRNRTDGLSRSLAVKLVTQQAQMGLPLAWEPGSDGRQSDTSASSDPEPPSGRPSFSRTVRKVSA
jgi:transcriptional regulator with XRE-family HTH domain